MNKLILQQQQQTVEVTIEEVDPPLMEIIPANAEVRKDTVKLLSHALYSLQTYLSGFVPWKPVNMQKISFTKIYFLRSFLHVLLYLFCYNDCKLRINFELQLCKLTITTANLSFF